MDEYLAVARTAAREAGRIHADAFRTNLRIEHKSPDDIVTDVDRRAEAAIHDRIRQAFPDHAILAEETGEETQNGSSYRWIVDPLDGTTNFVRGIPHFCVSIALEIDGLLAVGVVFDLLPRLKSRESHHGISGRAWP